MADRHADTRRPVRREPRQDQGQAEILCRGGRTGGADMSELINALAVSGLSSAAITLAPGAEAHRASLLKIAKDITEVDEFTLDAASDALKLLQEPARAVGAQRVKEKAPALDF